MACTGNLGEYGIGVFLPEEDLWVLVLCSQVSPPGGIVDFNDIMLEVFYVREPGGELLGSYDGTNTRYYHFDALGSTVDVTDGSGSSVGSYAYGAWGNVAGTTGATVYPYLYVGQLGYYTHTSDQETEVQSWLNLGVRFYDPEIGRFERPGSPYAYGDNSPLAGPDFSSLTSRKPPKPKPPSFEDVVKCAHKATKTCLGKGLKGQKFDACWYTGFGKCVGKGFVTKNCPDYYCYLFPSGAECWNGNPCKRKGIVDKGQCCDVKKWCCLVFNPLPMGAVKCDAQYKNCLREACE